MVKRTKRRSLTVGDTVLDGKYEILKIIHTSGMANVYLVSDRNLNKQWCLKEIVRSEAGRDNVEYVSLLQEANIMKSLNHSGIPRIVTIEEDGDSIFIIMDYVDGISVKEWLRRKGAIKQDIAVSWIKQVCKVLIYLHNRKRPIYYRDMKPDNIMIQEDGNVKLLDFGISVVITEGNNTLKKGQNLGTPGYAAPEQSKIGSKFDTRGDIYSLGRTLYHMLTGISPAVVGKAPLRPMREINSSISVGLEVIVGKCIQKNPDDRYQTMEEVLYDLENYEKLDTEYIKKVRRKVNITAGLFIGSLALFGLSFVPLGMYRSQEGKLYNELVQKAVQTGRTSDYLEAISLKPLEVEPYSGLIDSMKVDGVFTKEEESSLLNLVNPSLSDLRDDKDFGELAYGIGKLYWFYYEGSDGDTVGSKWFKESIDEGYNVEESNIYYALGSFKRNISMSVAEASDTGMYAEYWGNLMSAKGIDSGEIVELQIYNSIADAISTYAYRLRTDGVAKEELLNEIENIRSYLRASNPTSEKSIELYERLSSSVEGLDSKVEIAYAQGGGQ